MLDNSYIKNCAKNHGFSFDLPVLTINLKNIKQNINEIKRLVNVKICAVVKSNAYGHGLERVGSSIEKQVDFFAVATLSEGIRLRLSGVKVPILVLIPTNQFERAYENNLTITLESIKMARAICEFYEFSKKKLRVHISVNSGMNRMGIDSISELEKIILLCENKAEIGGIYSHFYSSEIENCRLQLERFLPFQRFLKARKEDIISHISSSGQIEYGSEYHLDMVRTGLVMYGYKPVNSTLNLKPAMKVYGKILKKRKLSKGESFLYGPYKTSEIANAGICAFGYDNGLMFGVDNLLNRCCMNLCGVELGGDFVLLLDDAEKYAKLNNTITYHALTALGKNHQKIYIGDTYESNCGEIPWKKT